MSDLDVWKINYELHLDPHRLAEFWKGGAPPGCALALKAAVSEVERLEERATWLGNRVVELEQDAEEQRQLKIAMTAERDRLAAENERLREALEPFARLPVSSLYDNQPPYDPGYVMVLAEHHQAPDVTRGEILEANAALDEIQRITESAADGGGDASGER